jgi:squalene synthase HpnC
VLLPARLRRPMAVIYWFARRADDFADEGDHSPAKRLALLEGFREALRGLAAGKPADDPFFASLGEVIATHRLPFQPFHDLLDAFSQDVTKARYSDYAEVLDYCTRSANPVGRLVLHLFGAAGEREHLQWSDAICTSLQLINFWQDVAIDYAKDRVYLPQDELTRFAVTEAQIAAGDANGAWPALMRFQVERARALMLAGAPLVRRLPGRMGLELRTIVQGGLRIAEKIDRVHGDVFRRRPVLRPADWPVLLMRALAM